MAHSNRVAKADDWKTELMPPEHVVLHVDHSFTTEEMARIQWGLIPEEMEDKWFIFYEDGTLYMHRSWTGLCIYQAHFTENDGKFELSRLLVNRNPEQYSSTDDAQYGEMFVFLVKVLLLGDRSARPPLPKGDQPTDDRRALWLWSMIGRAMFGDSDPSET